MNSKRIYRRFMPLALAILLVCTGCGVDSRSETEDEALDDVLFATWNDAFTVTNKEGQTLSYDGENVSGSMEVFEQKISKRGSVSGRPEPEEFFARLPYSSHYVFERTDELAQLEESFFAVNAFLPRGRYQHFFTIKSTGVLQRVEYDESGELCIIGDPGSMLEITTAMPCDLLGESGFLHIAPIYTQGEINLIVRDNTLSFSGFEHMYITLSYGGNLREGQEFLELSSGSGTIELSTGDDGKIIVSVDYYEA